MSDNTLISLVLTVVVEIILSVIVGIREKKILYAIVCMNFLTNPIVVCLTNLLRLYIGEKMALVGLLIMETLVVFVEGYFLKKECIELKKPYILAGYLNILSFLIGILISYIILEMG